MRVGRLTSAPGSDGVTEGLLSGLSSDERDGVSTRSGGCRCSRAGRVTAPVGRISISLPEVVVFTTGAAGLASRPFSTRDRRSSSSSGTPGVRIDAPVDVDAGGIGPIRGGRFALPVLASLSTVADRTGKPFLNGSSVIARLASDSSALLVRRSSLPICLALAVVTARS